MPSLTPSLHDSKEVDLSVFKAREIRNILKSKAHCLRAGFPLDHMILSVLDEIRDDYVKRVGLATYLSQMLGDLANVSVQDCAFFDESERLIEVNLNRLPTLIQECTILHTGLWPISHYCQLATLFVALSRH